MSANKLSIDPMFYKIAADRGGFKQKQGAWMCVGAQALLLFLFKSLWKVSSLKIPGSAPGWYFIIWDKNFQFMQYYSNKNINQIKNAGFFKINLHIILCTRRWQTLPISFPQEYYHSATQDIDLSSSKVAQQGFK